MQPSPPEWHALQLPRKSKTARCRAEPLHRPDQELTEGSAPAPTAERLGSILNQAGIAWSHFKLRESRFFGVCTKGLYRGLLQRVGNGDTPLDSAALLDPAKLQPRGLHIKAHTCACAAAVSRSRFERSWCRQAACSCSRCTEAASAALTSQTRSSTTL